MIGLILGIVLFCAAVFILLRLFKDYVPPNVVQAIWGLVTIVVVLWIAAYVGIVPAHFAHGRAAA